MPLNELCGGMLGLKVSWKFRCQTRQFLRAQKPHSLLGITAFFYPMQAWTTNLANLADARWANPPRVGGTALRWLALLPHSKKFLHNTSLCGVCIHVLAWLWFPPPPKKCMIGQFSSQYHKPRHCTRLPTAPNSGMD